MPRKNSTVIESVVSVITRKLSEKPAEITSKRELDCGPWHRIVLFDCFSSILLILTETAVGGHTAGGRHGIVEA